MWLVDILQIWPVKSAYSEYKDVDWVSISLNLHLHERVLEHRNQKYFGEVSFWPAEYRNRPPIVPLIFNFKNFGEF